MTKGGFVYIMSNNRETLYTGVTNNLIREKQIKDINRKEKLAMIYKFNPKFKDLYDQIV